MAMLRQATPLFEEETNVYEKEWDLLVVLDACRTDALVEVADDYPFLNDPGTHRSTAGVA